MQYWINTGDKKHGPFSASQLKKLALKGELKRNHKISTDQKRWVVAESVKGLVFKADEAWYAPVTEDIRQHDAGVRDTTTNQQHASQPSASNPTPSVQKRHVATDVEALSDTEIAQSLLQGTPNSEAQPASIVNEVANTADRNDKPDGEVLRLLFSNRRELLSRRLAAWVIDALVISVVSNIVFVIVFVMWASFGYFLFRDPLSNDNDVSRMVTGGPTILLAAVAQLCVALRLLFQRDAGFPGLGKSFLGIMTVDNAARPCTPDRSFRRNVVLLVPAMPIVEGIIALKRKDCRRLGDLMAGTSVVREYLPLLNQAISSGQPDTVWKIACWILQTEMRIPDKYVKQRNANLLRMFRHIIQRQKLVCDRFANLNTAFKGRAAVLDDVQSVVDQQLITFRKMSRSGWIQKGLKVEHVHEFHSLQQKKLELVAELRNHNSTESK
jgi:uncharacterized RDD family membrane protein YckC